MDGLNLLEKKQRDLLIGQSGTFHATIAADGWKFHFCEKGGHELLFNTADDSYETRNRIADADAGPKACALRAQLTASLSSRNHPAAQGGVLAATASAPTKSEVHRRIWPGFHSIRDENCDLLH